MAVICYDELDEMALSILMDYSDGYFPVDLNVLCEKLRIKLIKYSKLGFYLYSSNYKKCRT